MMQLAIIADDLTGALDAAAPFALRGLRTLVALTPSALAQCVAMGPVIVGVSTDSRDLQPDAARDAVTLCLGALPDGMAVFKKIDSRLKGNIEAELGALKFTQALVVPAIPAFGRHVSDAHVIGFGVDQPIDIKACLGGHAAKAVIPDVRNDHDIARALDEHPEALLVGARGLAEVVASRMAPEVPLDLESLRSTRLVFVIGSQDPITEAQVLALCEARPDVAYIDAPNGVGPEKLPQSRAVTIIKASAGDEVTSASWAATALTATLNRVGIGDGDVVFISGGATAQEILGSLGVEIIELVGEVLPGLPIARAGKFTLVTKSGGFGDELTLVRLLDRLVIE